MNSDDELRINKILQIMDMKDPKNFSYIIPSIKLIKCDYVENSDLEVPESMISFLSRLINYIIEMSTNTGCESRLVTESAFQVVQLVSCIYERIPNQGDNHSTVISDIINLFDNQKDDVGVCSAGFSFINYLNAEVLHFPKPLIEKLCAICSYILSHTELYSDLIFSYTLSLISVLIQLSENMEWFTKNGLIYQLSTLFNSASCTITMCRYFIIILNQIAADEAHINELINSIGFSIIINCIQAFAEEANTIGCHHQIVELSFVYLLRLFVSDTKNRIEQNQEGVTELIRFLYECLFSPYYLINCPQEEGQEENAQPVNLISVEYETEGCVLMEYVMSLFALLCYNSEKPEIVHQATISHLCQRINTLCNMNVVLFLHQFLYFCVCKDASLISIVFQDNNLQELVENLHQYPSESLLTVFAQIIHFNEHDDIHYDIVYKLIDYSFPSLLINFIIISNSNHASLPIQSYSVDLAASSATLLSSESDRMITNKQVSSKVQLISLDLLHEFYKLGSVILLEDSQLIMALLEIAQNSMKTNDQINQSIVYLAGTLLLLIGKHSNNFVFFENEPNYISIICTLMSQSQTKPNQLSIFFLLLEQYSYYGSIQRLLKDEKFVELLRQTERQIADNSVILQENGSNEIIEGILDLSSDFCSIFYIIAERLAGMSPQEYPVLGEVFTFLESLFACVVDKDVIYMAVQACQSFLKGGVVDIKERMNMKIRESIENGMKQGKYDKECEEQLNIFLSVLS